MRFGYACNSQVISSKSHTIILHARRELLQTCLRPLARIPRGWVAYLKIILYINTTFLQCVKARDWDECRNALAFSKRNSQYLVCVHDIQVTSRLCLLGGVTIPTTTNFGVWFKIHAAIAEEAFASVSLGQFPVFTSSRPNNQPVST